MICSDSSLLFCSIVSIINVVGVLLLIGHDDTQKQPRNIRQCTFPLRHHTHKSDSIFFWIFVVDIYSFISLKCSLIVSHYCYHYYRSVFVSWKRSFEVIYLFYFLIDSLFYYPIINLNRLSVNLQNFHLG